MSSENSSMSELEIEFTQELRGVGSLSPHLTAGEKPVGAEDFVGYDIRPEDLESLYFEGLGVPRWESIEAENNERQLELYWEAFHKCLAPYPMISRVSDTDQKIKFEAGEVSSLREECEILLAKVSDPKAARTLQKFIIAGRKAEEVRAGLLLIPN